MTTLLESFPRLYQIPIETLDLSEMALRVLKWYGLTSVALCIWFYIQDAHGAIREARLPSHMYGEVEAALKAQGYWSYVLDMDVWQDLRCYSLPVRSAIVLWQGHDFDLHNIPIEELGLSEPTIEHLCKRHLGNVAACMDFFIHRLNRHPRSRQGAGSLLDNAGGHNIATAYKEMLMLDELEQALKERGYWRFVDENLDD